MWIYTPPGYETGTAGKYPLLVLQHGSGDSHQTSVVYGKAHWILDNLISAGKARPMVVVMLDGHPFSTSELQDPAKRSDAMGAFRRELFEDALPLVEARYRVEKDASQRGIVGLSMGGGQSLTVGLGNLDRFAWVGSFSGGAAGGGGRQSRARRRRRHECKTPAALDRVRPGRLPAPAQRGVHRQAQGRRHRPSMASHGGGHSGPIWRGYVADFLPLVFQPGKR